MPSVIIRIALRYLAAVLVARGWLAAPDAAMLSVDAELIAVLQIGAGLIAGPAAEAWYWAARRAGGST